ncbi:hypothetical protein SAMN02982929_07092 [Saccharopolyspora kobensis]|uniref:DUF4352 domain-containing protein n=1 Tax=Saccharopolyspora kobensis TaxID=146035 RepID=A0A1H6EKU8_9PSEU|nr:hypothetical protein [Saccharopolyspora kobensis]SEG98490.1 hypothetical protein SAMN02982929_07092 [Saccharopolyspora kobensis]SFF26459.1 hypothetical protein SAMN05216506_12430 [Saccharopolyspora kobensis]
MRRVPTTIAAVLAATTLLAGCGSSLSPTGNVLRSESNGGKYLMTSQVVGYVVKPELSGKGSPLGKHHIAVLLEVRNGFEDRPVEASKWRQPTFTDNSADEAVKECPARLLGPDCGRTSKNWKDVVFLDASDVLERPGKLTGSRGGVQNLEPGEPYYALMHREFDEAITPEQLTICAKVSSSEKRKSEDCTPLSEVPELPAEIAEAL